MSKEDSQGYHGRRNSYYNSRSEGADLNAPQQRQFRGEVVFDARGRVSGLGGKDIDPIGRRPVSQEHHQGRSARDGKLHRRH